MRARIQFNLSIEEATTLLEILTDYGHQYTHQWPRHEKYDNDITTSKLKRMILNRRTLINKQNGMDNQNNTRRQGNRRSSPGKTTEKN